MRRAAEWVKTRVLGKRHCNKHERYKQMIPIEMVKTAIRSAKSRLQDRISAHKDQIAADSAAAAREIEILDKHAALLVTVEHLTKNYHGVLGNLDAALEKDNPIRTVVGNLRGYTFPGCDAMAPLANYDVVKRYKAEIIAELKAQTVDLAAAQLEAFRAEHKAVLAKHGI